MSELVLDMAASQAPVSAEVRPEASISISSLSFSYNGLGPAVIRDLSLEIPPRTASAILGPNGSGKTTLLRLILGVRRPATGAIRVAGRPQHSYSRRELSRLIGLVPQDEHIPFDFSILEYVLMGRAPYLGPLATPQEEDYQVALDALEAAGLGGMHNRPLPKVSGGERQLAVVARTLAQQPRIVLLDEPTAHLDLSNQGRLLGIMRALVAGGTTLVLTTHDPNLAASVAGYTVLMRDGHVLQAGPTDSVLTAENLSETYAVPVQVAEIGERRVILLL